MSANALRIQHDSWLVVCDGARSLILRNDGNADHPKFALVETFHRVSPAAHEQGTDRPGRVHQSHGTARSALEEKDHHLASEEAFINEVVAALTASADTGAIKRLVLVAPPKVLGELRRRCPPSVQAIIVADVGKDLTRMPIHQIEGYFAK